MVRYEAGARFPAHPHPEAEELLVLAGVFSDEHGDWAEGTCLLNPEGSPRVLLPRWLHSSS
jgi:anti-sigma factor ChrR (cupin superfamily)